MGSTTPPDTLKELRQPSQSSSDPKKCEQLERLLTIKEQEIRLLKSQLEKYKLALSQSQVQQQRQTPLASASTETRSASDNDENLLDFPQDEANFTANSTVETIISDVVEKLVADDEDETSDISPMEESFTKESPNHSKTRMPMRQAKTSCSSATFSSGKVVPKEGPDDDDDDDERDSDEKDKEKVDTHVALSSTKEVTAADSNQSSDDASDTIDDELYSVIQDVGEIDLNMELKREQRKRRKVRAVSLDSDKKSIDKDDAAQLRVKDLFEDGEDDHGPDDDEDIISDGLLTSLTDAAINNLSQLAALQERCESQDSSQSHHQYSEQTSGRPGASQTLDQQVTTSGLYTSRPSSIVATTPIVSSTSISSTGLGSIRRHSQQSDSSNRDLDSFNVQNPFSASNIANQAALAISAAAAALHHKPAPAPPSSSSILSQSQTSSISSNSNLQTDLSSGQSLASAVAAAAVAAAAANDQQQQQHHHPHPHPHPTQNQPHQLHSTSQSRLISSALSSPEFYQNLHQQHQRSQASQAASMQHQVSSLHSYSPASPINPSPLSLLAHSRRPASNTSSSFMSPISSPNYLRRQFMPDRLPIMSPSPSSMTSGTGSGASSSLAHILQQHHQQRSASAMACQITSQSSTPLSGTGSSVMSPMMGSQNSSQARLNNMQIRHKFGYLGSSRGQFNSPHGFCLGLNQEIVVADTNNHRICIFDKGGSYITQFGSPGKEEGQLWNPRKVAILHRSVAGGVNQRQSATGSGSNQLTGEPLYVVCDRGAERSRMQLFTKDGLFIKKIGIHYIDIVAGLAITQNGLIIVVDSVSPTVYIINAETGTLNGWFDCSGHMKEPSDIAVKSEMPGNEYFICDFKGHCVVVFNEQGEYLRKIGHDGLTSYPNGIDISDDGDILVGDSHGNRFHVVVFDRNGNFVSQFECPHVKVSRCCGLKITREGYIVTLAKNNHHVLVLDTIHI